MSYNMSSESGSDRQPSNYQALMDFASPQRGYQMLMEGDGVVEMGGQFLIFNRPDAEYVLRHHEVFSSKIDIGLGAVRPLIPLNIDPPRHSKYRKLLDPLFAPQRMDEQEADITRRVNALIDGFIDNGECHFTDQFADVFPTSVFLGLVGLPEDELPNFLRFRDVLHPERLDPEAAHDTAKAKAAINAVGQEMYAYFTDLIALRRAEPSNDIITRFLSNEIDGEKLTDEEILDICYLLMIAGLDNVSDSLTCMYAFLAQNPEHRRQIANDPSIIASAVEELMRWETPAPVTTPRLCVADVELPGGHTIKAGSVVSAGLGTSNVDPATFGDPLEVRFGRSPNPHLAFGGGVHRCLGSHLARRELRITLQEWHRRIPEYTIKPGHEDLNYPPGPRHVTNLVLSWGRA
jgi:cytochrome P450